MRASWHVTESFEQDSFAKSKNQENRDLERRMKAVQANWKSSMKNLAQNVSPAPQRSRHGRLKPPQFARPAADWYVKGPLDGGAGQKRSLLAWHSGGHSGRITTGIPPAPLPENLPEPRRRIMLTPRQKAEKERLELEERLDRIATANVPARLKKRIVIDIADKDMDPIQHKRVNKEGAEMMLKDHVHSIIGGIGNRTTSIRDRDPNWRTDDYIPMSARTLTLQQTMYHVPGESSIFLEECLKKNVNTKATGHM
jgi:hypothetical protein